jgi:hypothetical protein
MESGAAVASLLELACGRATIITLTLTHLHGLRRAQHSTATRGSREYEVGRQVLNSSISEMLTDKTLARFANRRGQRYYKESAPPFCFLLFLLSRSSGTETGEASKSLRSEPRF